jgi:hypothetical protein
MGEALRGRGAQGSVSPELADRIVAAFSRIEVKPPLTTAATFLVYRPTAGQVAEVGKRLLELHGQGYLLALGDRDFAHRVAQVWELVRWIHTNQDPTVNTAGRPDDRP